MTEAETTANQSQQKDVGRTKAKKKTESGGFVEFIRTVVFAVLIALVVRIVAFEPFSIPSESMVPNLLIGDHLFVSKYSYGYSRHSIPLSPIPFKGRIFESVPKRGDVVVFKKPLDNKTDFIKRVIGLPGDRLTYLNGVLRINGELVKRERVEDFIQEPLPRTACWRRRYYLRAEYRATLPDGSRGCAFPQYRETLPDGTNYLVLDVEPRSDTNIRGEVLVPEGHLYVMGDNRDLSSDCRIPGAIGPQCVPFENLVGRAEVIFFSTDGEARLWQPWKWIQSTRFGRIFKSLRT